MTRDSWLPPLLLLSLMSGTVALLLRMWSRLRKSVSTQRSSHLQRRQWKLLVANYLIDRQPVILAAVDEKQQQEAVVLTATQIHSHM